MWKCDTCIHKDNLEDKKGICIRLCKDVFQRLSRENQCYQEMIKKPLCCGLCNYLLKSPVEDDSYICKVYNWDVDDMQKINNIVRRNYLTKNTSKWCKLLT